MIEGTVTEVSEINKAVAAVMAGVHRLEKAGVNAFDKYNFTSVDDFKDHLRPLMAKEGLHVSISETDLQIVSLENSQGKMKNNVRVTYSMRLHHASGQVAPPDLTTVILPYTGAQTAGIAKSYAIKEWIKGRFLASSGDTTEEADMRAQDTAVSQVLSKKEARPLYEALQRELRSIIDERNSQSLLQWAQDNRTQLGTLPVDWREELRDEYGKAFQEIRAAEKADGMK